MKDEVFLNLIPYGKENAISKDELCMLTGYSERLVRRTIHKLRDKGEFIMSNSHHTGYWLTDDMDEVKVFFAECDSRRNELAMQNMRKRYYGMTGQEYTIVKEHIRRVNVGKKKKKRKMKEE